MVIKITENVAKYLNDSPTFRWGMSMAIEEHKQKLLDAEFPVETDTVIQVTDIFKEAFMKNPVPLEEIHIFITSFSKELMEVDTDEDR